MEEIRGAKYANIKDDHSKANDEKIMSIYLQSRNDNGDSWPESFIEDTDVFNKNTSEVFDSENPLFVFVYPTTEACGRTDGCDSGCWRIIGHDKLIKYKNTGKILVFKKILKFWGKTKARGYKRTWVMEQYRLPSKWNPKQEHVVCRIHLMFQSEISFLLSKHFSYSSDPLPPATATQSLPAYGVCLANPQDDGAYHLQTIFDSGGNEWPSYVMRIWTAYSLTGKRLVVIPMGVKAVAGGSWKVMDSKRVFKFYEEDKDRYFDILDGEEVLRTWIMEEYRLVEEAMKDKSVVRYQASEVNSIDDHDSRERCPYSRFHFYSVSHFD